MCGAFSYSILCSNSEAPAFSYTHYFFRPAQTCPACQPADEAADLTVGTAGTSIAGMLCEGRFALYLAGEPYKSGLKAQGCGKLKKAVFTMELDPDEKDETEAE